MKSKNLFWGLFFVVSAGFIVASQVVPFDNIGVWSIIASVFLAAVFITALINREFVGIFLPLSFLYMIYDKALGLPEISPWILIAAAVMTSIGCHLLFRKRPKKFQRIKCSSDSFGSSEEDLDGNRPGARVSMGAASKYLHADCLQGGQFSCSLGELEVYFDQVILSPEGAEVFVDCSLGSVKLYIPKNWKVVNNLHASLGDVKNDNRFNKPDVNAPPLTLTGNVHLGSVEIHYI